MSIEFFTKDEQPTMAAFNERIQGAKDEINNIYSQISTVTTLANSKAQIATGSYTGTGTYGSSNPNSLTFTFSPKLVFVFPSDSSGTFSMYGMLMARPITTCTIKTGSTGTGTNKVTWAGNTVRWYTTQTAGSEEYYQCNKSGTVYYWYAIG